MPSYDIAMVLLGAQSIMFASWWGRVLEKNQRRPAADFTRDARVFGAIALAVGLVDYAAVLIGRGSPIAWLLWGR